MQQTNKYRKKPVVIEAALWNEHRDHFAVERYTKNPEIECNWCSKLMDVHGWIDTLEGGHIVCPGDWIITGVKGEHYPCKPDIFERTYEPVFEAEEVPNE
jgi:hypothetical protein